MKRLAVLFVLICSSVLGQIQNIPNTTFPAVRTLLNSNFSWISTNKAGISACSSNLYAIQTTTAGVVCAALTSLQITTALGFTPAVDSASITINSTTCTLSSSCTISSGGTPGGTDGQFQYNNAGSFGGGTLANCVATGGVLQYTVSTHTFSCHTLIAGDIPTLNQNTTGTAANLSGTPALPNGTTGTTQTQADNSTKLATTAYVDALGATKSGTTAGGDLSGTLPSPTVIKINGTTLSGLATGILKNTTGTGVPSIAVAGDFPNLNQNTSGTAANLSGTPALPNGVTATTQSASDNSTKVATTAYVDAAATAATPKWSSIIAPTVNLSIAHAAFSTTFTYNAATGSINGFKLTDTLNNTGSGILAYFTTASGSGMTPWQGDVNGVGWKVHTDGSLKSVGATTNGIWTFSGITSGSCDLSVANTAVSVTNTCGSTSKYIQGNSAQPAVNAGSCTGATIGTGATNIAGTITGLPTGTCSVVITFASATAATGWACAVSDQTTANLFRQTASNTTTATLAGTSVSGDVLSYMCAAY